MKDNIFVFAPECLNNVFIPTY